MCLGNIAHACNGSFSYLEQVRKQDMQGGRQVLHTKVISSFIPYHLFQDIFVQSLKKFELSFKVQCVPLPEIPGLSQHANLQSMPTSSLFPLSFQIQLRCTSKPKPKMITHTGGFFSHARHQKGSWVELQKISRVKQQKRLFC